MGPGAGGLKYILLLKNDISSYIWLIPFVTKDAENVVSTLKIWIRKFSVMKDWVCDRVSHFKNTVMEILANL